MTTTLERIMKACPTMKIWTGRGSAGVWISTPQHQRAPVLKRLYESFPPGYRFLIYFDLKGGGSANQPFITGRDPFPVTYGGKRVTAYDEDTHVSGPSDLLRTLINLNQLSS